MGDQITIHIDAALVAKLRAKAIADGLPNARKIPDEELLAALIRAEVGEAAGTVVSPPAEAPAEPIVEPPVEVVPTPVTVRVKSRSGLYLRGRPVAGSAVIKILADQEELRVLGQQEEWLEVQTTDGTTGWVLAPFVTQVGTHTSVSPQRNVRGIHGAAGAAAPPEHLWDAWIGELKAMSIAWYKQLDAGDPHDVGDNSTFEWALTLKQNGVEPIIRYVQGQMFPGRLHDLAFEKMKRYAADAILWCEIGNEPNVDQIEWHSDHQGKVSWQNATYPRLIVENWIADAERAVAAGARPGFYAFAPTDWGPDRPHPQLSSVMFYERMFEHVAANPDLQERFCRLFEPGKAWLAVHVSPYELPFDFDPFPVKELPYDMCLRGYEVPLHYMRELVLGDIPITVMSTEGGVFSRDSASMAGHARLQSHQQHAQRTVEMFDWIQKYSPLLAMCPWLISNVYQAIGHSDPAWVNDGWYQGGPPGFGARPVVQAMKSAKPAQ